MSVQQFNGVVDIAVADEAEAVAVAKQYLSYFQGSVAEWTCVDPTRTSWRDPRGSQARLRRSHR
jgi:acetyl-CoA carboxylase carboxyltransferase component